MKSLNFMKHAFSFVQFKNFSGFNENVRSDAIVSCYPEYLSIFSRDKHVPYFTAHFLSAENLVSPSIRRKFAFMFDTWMPSLMRNVFKDYPKVSLANSIIQLIYFRAVLIAVIYLREQILYIRLKLKATRTVTLTQLLCSHGSIASNGSSLNSTFECTLLGLSESALLSPVVSFLLSLNA
jgi:hypothetical protein